MSGSGPNHGYNPRNWPAANNEQMDVQLFSSEVAVDEQEEKNIDVLYADDGGRDALIETQLALGRHTEELLRQAMAMKAKGETPPKELEDEIRKGASLINITRADLDLEVSDKPGDYLWIRPWRNEPGQNNKYAKGAGLRLGGFFSFGRQRYGVQVPGLLVVEVSIIGVVVEGSDGMPTLSPPILLDRYRIDRPMRETGGFDWSADKTLTIFRNKDVLYDFMMSFVRAPKSHAIQNGEDRSRSILIDVLAPDEKTLEWVSVMRLSHTLDYRFTTMKDERDYHSVAYLADQGTGTPAEARDAKLAQLQTMMREDRTVAIFSRTAFQEGRTPIREGVNIPEVELRSRAAFLGQTAIPQRGAGLRPLGEAVTQKRERTTEDDKDTELQAALLQSVEDELGAQKGAGSSNTNPEADAPEPKRGKGKGKARAIDAALAAGDRLAAKMADMVLV